MGSLQHGLIALPYAARLSWQVAGKPTGNFPWGSKSLIQELFRENTQIFTGWLSKLFFNGSGRELWRVPIVAGVNDSFTPKPILVFDAIVTEKAY